MTRVFSTRQPSANYDTVYPDALQDTYADGVADVMFQDSSIKIALFQSRPLDLGKMAQSPGADHPAEVREVVGFVTMPVAQFVEAFSAILSTVAANYSNLQKVAAIRTATLEQQIEQIARSGIGAAQQVVEQGAARLTGVPMAVETQSVTAAPKRKRVR